MKKKTKKKINAGDNINTENANWKFSGKTAKNFDNHINKSVPLYRWTHDLGLNFSDFFLSKPCNVYDLGCSTGKFLKSLSIRNKEKKINFYGVDEIKDMCKIAKKNTSKFHNVKIINSQIEKLKFKNAAFITSYYTIQFLHPSTRQKVFDRIFKSLNWGVLFYFFEKVRAPDARFQDIITQIYTDYKIEQGYSSEEILSKSKSLKGILDPYSSSANILMLKRAGFKDITSVFKFLCFEGFLAIK